MNRVRQDPKVKVINQDHRVTDSMNRVRQEPMVKGGPMELDRIVNQELRE